MDILGIPYLPLSTVTTLPNGQANDLSQESYTYDSGFSFYDTNMYAAAGGGPFTGLYGLVQSTSQTDWGTGSAGPVLSTTNTNYLYSSNSSYVTANILDLPSSMIMTDGSGNKCAETDYGYDEAGRLVTFTGTLTQHTTAPNSVRGNLTSMTKQLSGTPCKSGATWTPLPSTVFTVYDTGMRASATDPRNNTTTYSYVPVSPCTVTNYYGAFLAQTTYPITYSPNQADLPPDSAHVIIRHPNR